MATFEQETAQRQALTATLDDLAKIEPESLVRADELGRALSFESGLDVFRRVLGLFKDLRDCNLDNLPFEALSVLTNQAEIARSTFKEIKAFTVQQYASNPTQARDQLIARLRDNWNTYFSTVTPYVSYAVRRGTDFDALEREARGALTLVKSIGTDAQTQSDKILAEMRGALEKVRQAAAEAGVAQHAIHFKQEADLNRRQSLWWMIAAAVFGAGTIIYAIYSLEFQLHAVALNVPPGRLVALTISRLIVISILSTGIVFCVRNYSANRHNLVINRHRQNALSTFETFVKASTDNQTKDSVLLQATRSIFMPQPSGYLKGEGETPQANQIIEIMRNLTTSKQQ